jgi:hypothetical protein
MNLHTELDDVRSQIRDIRLDMSRLAYEGWPWESRHNTKALLARLTAYEAELVERIESEERHTDALVASAMRSGDPALFTLAYILVGTAPEAA